MTELEICTALQALRLVRRVLEKKMEGLKADARALKVAEILIKTECRPLPVR